MARDWKKWLREKGIKNPEGWEAWLRRREKERDEKPKTIEDAVVRLHRRAKQRE